jgi:hypothetical protein
MTRLIEHESFAGSNPVSPTTLIFDGPDEASLNLLPGSSAYGFLAHYP